MGKRLEIHALGGLVVKTGETPLVTLESQKAAALLVYLAMTRREQPRELLAELFFSERTQQQSLTNLRVVIHRLRQQLDPFLLVTRQTIGINPDHTCWFDAVIVDGVLTAIENRFRQNLALTNDNIAALEDAFALYRGDFLAGFSVNESYGFENWAMEERERLRTRVIEAVYQMIWHYGEQKAYSVGIAKAMRLLQIDPSHEPTHQQLLTLLARSGQRNLALAQHEAFRKRLDEEFGLETSPETEALYEQIQSGALGAETAPPLKINLPIVRAVAQSNLPIPATAFVGRSKEVKQILDLLDNPDCRLLTLVGQGGIGKTRLAIQAAQERINHYEYGVRYITLASITDPALLTVTLANALKLSIQGEKDILSQVNNYLRDKNILLVFDNFEHLLDGANALGEILAQCPHIKIIATSRERLNLEGEWLLPIGGLSYPDIVTPPADVEIYDAIKLFAHNAQRTQIGFPLSENIASVMHICRLVEGMPLAIEIAAGWLWSMSCPQIAEQITQDLDFLQSSVRNIPERHRSIRAIFEHSWKMLSEAERAALAALAVFQGSFDLQAVQMVTKVSVSTLERLISKSLVRIEGRRYDMHELTRQYAEEKCLEDKIVNHLTREHHADYYLSFLSTRGRALSTYQTKEVRQEIEPEFDNIRSGWLWAAAQGNTTSILHISPFLEIFYWVAGRYHEAIHIFEQAADCLTGAPAVVADLRARQGRFTIFLANWEAGEALLKQSLAESDLPLTAYILSQLAYSAYMQSKYDDAIPMFEQSLAIAEELHDSEMQAFALMSLGHISEVRSKYAQAKTCYNESLKHAKNLNNPFLQSQIINGLGQVATNEGLLNDARTYLEEAITIQRAVAHPQLLAQSLVRLGWVELRKANYEDAEKCFTEATLTYRDLGQQQGVGNAINGLGSVYYMSKRYEEAKPLFLECLALYDQIGAVTGKASVLGNLGSVCWATGAYEESERLFQQSLEIYEQIGNQFMRTLQLSNLGNAALMMADYPKAWAQFQKALEQALRVGAMGLAVGVLVDVAKLLVKIDAQPLALEILAFVLNYPLTEDEPRKEALSLLEEIKLRPDQLPIATQPREAEELIRYILAQGSGVFA